VADQGIWFKLWVSALDDGDLDNLDIADFGRWAKLSAYIKRHGTNGVITLTTPSRTLCAMLQVKDFNSLIEVIKRINLCDLEAQKSTVTGVTIATVTFRNWQKYQGDNSISRVRRFRQRVTVKKRGEEKRSTKKRIRESPASGDPKNTPFGKFKDWAWEEWKNSHQGKKPSWGKSEWACLHTAYVRIGSDEEARARWRRFLEEGESFFQGHNPKKFLSELDRWTEKARPPDTGRAPGWSVGRRESFPEGRESNGEHPRDP